MRRQLRAFCLLQVALLMVSTVAGAAGISVDAGLTPPEDRWILRTQFRYMRRGNDPTPMDQDMQRYVLNAVLAYGLRRNLTLMLKQQLVHQEMSMIGSESTDTGLTGLSVMAKYKIYRLNAPGYTFGIATTFGLKMPTGAEAFSSETWDASSGLYLSLRKRAWASDFNVAYMWNGLAGESSPGLDPGDGLSLDWTLAYQHSVGEEAEVSLTPVFEMSREHVFPNRLNGNDVEDTGETVIYVSPGLKFTRSSLILEALAQIPVWQEQEGSQLERGIGFLAGVRIMF